jgi:L-seryl-tRNA(Ser) seleniumtransferase
MPIPPFRNLGPSEAIKQLAQWVNQPMLTNALKEAAQKLGVREVPSLASLQELLRQAGRWIDVATEPWSENQSGFFTPGINATGEWFSGRWTGPRFAADTLALLNLIHTNTTEDVEAERQCCMAILGATGAGDALVAPNLGVALDLAVRGLHLSDRIERVVLPRKHCFRIPSGPSHGGSMLPDMLEACGIPVREIGSNRECLPVDFDRALDAPKQLLVVATCGPREASVHSGIERAHGNECLVCELALDGSIHDLADLGIPATALSRRWDHGPDLIIVPGHDLLAGPECGILLGKREVIQSIRKLAEGTGMLASRATHLLLSEAVRNASTREGWNATPVGATLSNSLANLQNRAKRIATQCDRPDVQVKVDAGTKVCKLGSGVWHETALESAVLRVTPKDAHAPSRIAERLSQHQPAIWGNIFSDHVELVLRTIDPAEDAVLVAALCELSLDSDASAPDNNAASN